MSITQFLFSNGSHIIYIQVVLLQEVAEQSSFVDSEKDVPHAIPMDIGMPEISDNLNDATVLDTPTDDSGNLSKVCLSQKEVEQSNFLDSQKDISQGIPMDIGTAEISDNLNDAIQFKKIEDDVTILDAPTVGSENSSKVCSSQIDQVVFNNTYVLKEADNLNSSDVSGCKEILNKPIIEDSQEIDTSMSLSCNVNDPPSSLGEKHEENSLTVHADDFLKTCIVEDSQEEMEQVQVIRQSTADQKYTDNVRHNPDICMVDEDQDSHKVDIDEDPLYSDQQNRKGYHKQSLISVSKDVIGVCNVVSLDDDDDLQIFSDDTIDLDDGLSEHNKPCKRQKLEHTEIQRIQTRSFRTSGTLLE